MSEKLKEVGFAILAVSVLPVAKFVASMLVALVKKSPRPEDDQFLKQLAEDITKQL